MSKLHNFVTKHFSLIIEHKDLGLPLFRYFGFAIEHSQTDASTKLLDTGIEQGSHDHFVGLPILNNFDSGCFGQTNLRLKDEQGLPLYGFRCLDFNIEQQKIQITMVDSTDSVHAIINFQKDSSGLLIAKQNLMKFKEHCDEKKVNCYIVNMPDIHQLKPYKLEFINVRIKKLADEIGFKFYDLLKVFDGINEKDLWNDYNDPHPNAYAHELIAKNIYDFFVN